MFQSKKMNNLQKISHKSQNLPDLLLKIKLLKKEGKKIVFTNGCFDILHVGHVQYLAQAAEKGDVLVVGINSDDSIKSLNKGENRPINELNARKTVLSALFFIDFVIEFNDNTPLNLIENILPDVLVKGADYDPNETDINHKKYIVGREVVLENGGKVEVINLVEGFSTTNIINKSQSC